MRIDHVIYAVSDLPRAVARFAEEFGLRATGGGAHPEFGTCNEIIPVGAGQYIELMAVADQASRHPLALLLQRLIRDGDRLMAVCLRPENLDEVAERLSIAAIPAERRNPDGEIVRWRLAGVEAALGAERLPFFIDWQGDEAKLDRAHDEAATADGIAWVEYGGEAARLEAWIGSHEPPLRILECEPGPQRLGVKRGLDTIVIR